MIYLVCRVENNRVTGVTGAIGELDWDEPFKLETKLMAFPENIFGGHMKRVYLLTHPHTVTGVAYYPLTG